MKTLRSCIYEIQNCLFNGMQLYEWRDTRVLAILEQFERDIRKDERLKTMKEERLNMCRNLLGDRR